MASVSSENTCCVINRESQAVSSTSLVCFIVQLPVTTLTRSLKTCQQSMAAPSGIAPVTAASTYQCSEFLSGKIPKHAIVLDLFSGGQFFTIRGDGSWKKEHLQFMSSVQLFRLNTEVLAVSASAWISVVILEPHALGKISNQFCQPDLKQCRDFVFPS